MKALNMSNQMEEAELEAWSCDSPSVHFYRYFAVAWGSLLSATGIVGNLMTILAFFSNSQLRTRFNVLIVNLAVTDLLYCTLLLPFLVDSYLHLRWRSGAFWCRIYGLLLLTSNGVSIITLCLIAVSRYLLVARSPLFQLIFTNRGLVLLLTFTWSVVLASVSPLWPVYVFVPKVCTCSFHRTRGRPYTSILLFTYLVVGLLSVGVFYMLIYHQVRISTKALRRYQLSRRSSRKKPPAALVEYGTDCSGVTGSCMVDWSSQTDLNQTKKDETKLGQTNVGWNKLDQTNLDHSTLDWTNQDQTEQDRSNLDRTKLNRTVLGQATADNHAGKQVPPAATVVSSVASPSTAQANEAPPTTVSSYSAPPADNSDVKRVTRMCFMVFLCFVLCFLPFSLITVLDKHNSAPHVLHMVCANLTSLNSCINPLLYAVMNRQFRQAYKGLLSRAAMPLTCLWARR